LRNSLLKINALILLIGLELQLSAQSNYRIDGIIIDTVSNSPIDFVNIGIIGNNVGSVCNDSGIFHLTIPCKFLMNNLSVSRIGYYPKSIVIGELTKHKTIKIFLVPKFIEIDEIQINTNKLKSYSLGNITRSHSIVGSITSDSSNLGREFGTVFHLPHNPVFIKDFNFHISYNRPYSAKLRLNIYQYANKEVDENLLKQNIFFTITNKDSGDYSIDLSQYKIHASNYIFIAVEIVAVHASHGPDPKIKYDNYSYNKILISCSLFVSKGFLRNVSMGEWERCPYNSAPGFWITILK